MQEARFLSELDTLDIDLECKEKNLFPKNDSTPTKLRFAQRTNSCENRPIFVSKMNSKLSSELNSF